MSDTDWRLSAENELLSHALKVRGDTTARLRAEKEELRAALVQCQRALEAMVAPEAIRSTSVQSAWAVAVAAETKARATLQKVKA